MVDILADIVATPVLGTSGTSLYLYLWCHALRVCVCELNVPVLLQNEADSALRKARLLQAQRQEEYEKAKVSTSRLEEEQIGGAAAAKQLDRRRRLEEEALQKV